MSTTIQYLTDIVFLLMAAVVAVPIFQTLRMGAVPGFVLAGVAVGPSGLGLIENVSEIGHLSELGVVLLLFVIGIELNPQRLWTMRRLLFGLGSLQVLCTSLIISATAYYLFGLSGPVSVLVGPALALSSTAFVLQLLTEDRKLNSEQGRSCISILLLQDLAVVPLLALVSLLAQPATGLAEDVLLALGEAVLIIGLVIGFGRYLLQPVLRRVAKSNNQEIFTASAVLLVLGAALLMEHVGLSMAMGAFLAGLLIADSSYRHQVMSETQPFRGLFLGMFFMSMGMTMDLAQLTEAPVMIIALTAALIVVKALVIWPLCRLFGMSGTTALLVALLLAQSGEFALVVFTLAFTMELLEQGLYQTLLLVVMISMLATPLLAGLARKLDRRRREKSTAIAPLAESIEQPSPVLIVGFGRVGHRIGQILEMAGIQYSAIDKDPDLVAREHGRGHPVYYGDANRPAVLRSLAGDGAGIAIIALNDQDVTEHLVPALRATFPDLWVLARGHNRERCDRLNALGVDVTVSENLEASIELARVTMAKANTPEDRIKELLDEFRSRYNRSP